MPGLLLRKTRNKKFGDLSHCSDELRTFKQVLETGEENVQGRKPTLMGKHLLFFPCTVLPTALCSVDDFLSLTSISFTGYCTYAGVKSRKHPALQGAGSIPCPEKEWNLDGELWKGTILCLKLSNADLENQILPISLPCTTWGLQSKWFKPLLAGHVTERTMGFVSLTWKTCGQISKGT